MKALVLKEYGKFSYEDVSYPLFGKNDVIIKVKACAVCGSDIHGMDGSTGRRRPPVIMGHEASGVIEEAGSDVKKFKIGDRVTFDSTIYCGECQYCKKGMINLCDNRRVVGVSCEDYRQNGAFAEYLALPERILYLLPDELTFERAAMIEPLSIALHALNNSKIGINDTAVVVGAGMIGLLIIQALKIAGCGKIYAIDIDEDKLKLAKDFGAANTLSKIKDVIDANIAFEAVGLSQTVNVAIDSLKKGGILTLVGNLSPTVEFPLQKVVTREIRVNGSCGSSGEYPACIDLIARGIIDVDTFISKVAPLKEGTVWFSRLYNKEAGLMKVILTP